jgi:hypothetical protein
MGDLGSPNSTMITFYPRDAERWLGEFDFNPVITLLPGAKRNFKTFRNQEDFFDFLKRYNVQFDNPEFPLRIEDEHPWVCEVRGIPGLQIVIQWTVLGWIKNDFR